MASCTSSRPSYVLDDDDMEDLLYDIHRAHFIQQQSENGEEGPMQYALFMSVLKKHKVTQAEWDSSMVYYTRHADEMEGIYSNLIDRLDNETSAMGAGMSEASDSSDIWKADRHILLTPDDLNATYQWKIDADTLVNAGEKLKIRFLSLFLNQNADRRATALISIRLNNDSVIVRQQILTQTAYYNIEISDDDNKGIKSISGLFMLHKVQSALPMQSQDNDNSSNSVQTSQILAITDIKLLHEDSHKAMREALRRDSINAANRPDSLKARKLDEPVSDDPQKTPAVDQAPPPLLKHP